MHKYLIVILVFISCNNNNENTSSIKNLTKDDIGISYVEKLHTKNFIEVSHNNDFINILSVKHDIEDSISKRIILDYLDMVNNKTRDYSNQYKIETIKNYAFENDLLEKQVAELLHDYVIYSDSKNRNHNLSTID